MKHISKIYLTDSDLIGEFLNLSENDLIILEKGAFFHDIGKKLIPQEILIKPYKLTNLEFLEIKKHPISGCKILEDNKVNNEIIKIVLQHHERPDGKGYPYGLKNNEISKFAKIISIVDVFDAITHNRYYEPAKEADFAINEILKNKGTQFDEEYVDFFMDFYKKYS